ncbi:hypothetical protein AB0933_32490 [Streptomyces venezuelae]|uniref:hypothetical protein n=1 Tax=Streptomyces venezuelae TaxID=54571 RepID=UPI0034512112
MAHIPFPDADRALRQVDRHAAETATESGMLTAGAFVRWPQVPEGWGAAVDARLRVAWGPFLEAFRARPVAVPQLVFLPGRTR